MIRHPHRALAWFGAAVGTAATVMAAALWIDRIAPETVGDWLQFVGVFGLLVGFGTVGFVLTLRRPDHPMGWLLLGFGATFAARLACEELIPRLDGAARDWAILLANAFIAVSFALLVAAAIVFPSGKPAGRWWQLALGAVVVIGAIGLATAPFVPFEVGGVTYPAPIEGYELLEGVSLISSVFGLLGIGLAALIRLVLLRFRGGPMERAQIRWVAYAIAVTLLVLLVEPFVHGANDVASAIAGIGIPVALAIAITRYRLYDIDRVVNRTVVYTLVVAVLAAVFAAGSVWLPTVLPFEDSNVAVAASTLAVFFLFNPLRRRVQRFVDHRFYRSRYDAQQIADEFSARLRDQVDPDQVAAEWAGVVQQTLHPASVGVWVPDPTAEEG